MKLVKKLSVLLLVFALVACGGNKAEEKKEVYIILKTQGGAYWSVVEQGAKDAAEKLGYKAVVLNIANENEIEKQVGLVDDAITAKPAAIIFAPADSKALAAQATKVKNAGIPLVLVDTLVTNEDYDAAYVTNNVNAGAEAAKQMIAKLKAAGHEGKEGTILIQKGNDSQTIIDRQKGFTDEFNASAPKEWKISNQFLIASDAEVAFNQGTTALGDKKVIGVFGTNNGPSVGWARALEETGRKDVVALTFDYSPEVEKLIKDETYNVTTIVQRQYYMGYEGVTAGIELSKGNKVTTKLNDTGILAVDTKNVNDDNVIAITKPIK